VSRVANGAGNVSVKTRTKVLTAISRLQYFPNAHAAELGRSKGGAGRKRREHKPGFVGTRAKSTASSGADVQKEHRQTRRLHFLEGEFTRVRRMVARLSKDLEKLKSIVR
jgi:hypothetical protein